MGLPKSSVQGGQAGNGQWGIVYIHRRGAAAADIVANLDTGIIYDRESEYAMISVPGDGTTVTAAANFSKFNRNLAGATPQFQFDIRPDGGHEDASYREAGNGSAYLAPLNKVGVGSGGGPEIYADSYLGFTLQGVAGVAANHFFIAPWTTGTDIVWVIARRRVVGNDALPAPVVVNAS